MIVKLFNESYFDFMGKQRIAILFSGLMLTASFLVIFRIGLNLGVDFTGGYTLELSYQGVADLNKARSTLEAAELGDTLVQNFGSADSVLVRIAPLEGVTVDDLSKSALSVLKQTSDVPINVRRIDCVGSQVGAELREKGGLAVLAALGAIAAYIWVCYEKKFALGAILATAHDAMITVGFFAVFRIEYDLTVLAAVLAVIGYSLNDTIVVFDRIREGFRTVRDASVKQLVNDAINQTLSRTLITSGTTLMVVVCLLLFGGQTIRGFALAFLIGISYGTYSSIYIASLTVLAMGITAEDLLQTEGIDIDH